MFRVFWLMTMSWLLSPVATAVEAPQFAEAAGQVELHRFVPAPLPPDLSPTFRRRSLSGDYDRARGVFRAGRIVGAAGMSLAVIATLGLVFGENDFVGEWIFGDGRGVTALAVGLLTITAGSVLGQHGMFKTSAMLPRSKRPMNIVAGAASTVFLGLGTTLFLNYALTADTNRVRDGESLAVSHVCLITSYVLAEVQQGGNRRAYKEGMKRHPESPVDGGSTASLPKLRVKLLANGVVGVF